MAHLLTRIAHDLRHARRGLRRRKAFALTAIASLALGIGAASALFSVVDAVLWKPLSLPEPDRLLVLAESRNGDPHGGNPQRLFDYAERMPSLEGVVGYYGEGLVLSGRGDPERVETLRTYGPIVRVLGRAPTLGRTFTAEEERGGGAPVVLLTDRLWKRRFSADPRIVGETLRLGASPMTVVGVLPPLDFPEDVDAISPSPLRAQEMPRRASFLALVARRKAGASLAQVQAEGDAALGPLGRDHPDTDSGLRLRVARLQDEQTREARTPLLLLLAAAGLLLLVVCVNVSSLLLARNDEQRHEAAIRTALGAGARDLRRLFLSESLLLAAAGAVLGLLAAVWGVDLLKALLPGELPRLSAAALDLHALAFAATAALAGGLVMGLLPAREATRDLVPGALRAGFRATSDPRRRRLRGLLVVAEVALAVVLVAGTALLGRAFLRLQSLPLGFRPEAVLTLDVAFPWDTPKDRLDGFMSQAVAALAGVPGVRRVGVADRLPFEGGSQDQKIALRGRELPPDLQERSVSHRAVSEDYFAVLGVPLVEGRAFEDRAERHELVVNAAFARRYFPGDSPLGQEVLFDRGSAQKPSSAFRIVGVVGDLRQQATQAEPVPETFMALRHAYWPLLSFVVQAEGDPAVLALAARTVLQRVDPEQMVGRVATLESRLDTARSEPRVRTLLLSGFSASALALAALGLFGLLAQDVAQRRREIAIRMALGAGPGAVVAKVVGRGLGLATLGLAAGATLALEGGEAVKSLLYGVEPTDPVALLGTAVVLFAVAAAASFGPARSATRVDPMTALRCE